MSKRRCGVGVAVLNDLLYAVGGHDGQSYLNSIERLVVGQKNFIYSRIRIMELYYLEIFYITDMIRKQISGLAMSLRLHRAVLALAWLFWMDFYMQLEDKTVFNV